MQRDDLRYYEKYSVLGNFRFLFDALFARGRAQKMSLANRQRDYLRLAGHPDWLALHRDLNRCLVEANAWSGYDYGEGYYYQSFDRIGITGLRSTRERMEAMGVADLVKDKTVLDIGCNAGFVSLTIAEVARHVTGCELNPYLVDLAKRVAEHLGQQNATFFSSSFEDFVCQEPFDVILSFANHSTYDGKTRQTVEQYFQRCQSLLKPGGLLLFESHAPEYEGDGLEHVCSIIAERFGIQERRGLKRGTFLDQGRTFIVAQKRKQVSCDAQPTSKLVSV